ncbi:alanine--tRNA ligase [Pseudothermotoga sp. U03pept]|uniref:alanine--tRNA ligase n=1 Tax=Pseudothermotoga sp. U03pept TaxID=3447012 RepID=UPI003F117FA3
MNSDELREEFLIFFESKGHKVLPSASLIPNDPQLLFTVAGMVPFKPIFWGKVKPVYTRVATCQKCLRTNDIDNVGRTPRHQTFFEMLGNFSFGDYFKKEAITWAWEFVTKILKLPEERLWVTIYRDDDEAFRIWKDLVGIEEKKIIRMGKETNFWGPAGPTGPCGPCSEIHYFTGSKPSDDCTPESCEEQFLEIWNLVFTEFNQDEEGRLHPLPKKNIDTGAGLERIASAIQNVKSNFETDLFKPVISRIEEVLGVRYGLDERKDISIRVIADHSRAVSFLIADGVFPSNEERGYVLRRILRRAVRHGVLLGAQKPFLHTVNDAVIERMKKVYPELSERRELIMSVTQAEEERFFKTIVQGNEMLKEIMAKSNKKIDGESVFKLYDTYGFPPDIVVDVARENGLEVDLKDFERLMEEQRQKARSARSDIEYAKRTDLYNELAKSFKTIFVGYQTLDCEAEVIFVKDDSSTPEVVFDKTPFYAERGGQVSDVGEVHWNDGSAVVEHVYIPVEGIVAHVLRIKSGQLQKGMKVKLTVDEKRRKATARNHTATHLLHAALKKVLGEHVKQAGSLVAPDRLRFDFTHHQSLTKEQLEKIEDLVNEVILNSLPVIIEEKSYKEAISEGAIALFNEKYGEVVRVVKVPQFSEELCGGTHVENTGNIGLFKIISEFAISAGTRRIEAITGFNSLNYLRDNENLMEKIYERLDASGNDILLKIDGLIEKNNNLNKELQQLRSKLLISQLRQTPSEQINNIKFLHCVFEEIEPNELRNLSDVAVSGESSLVVLLFSVGKDKVNLIVRVTQDLTKKIKAGDIAKQAAQILEGGGGGRPEFAQAGGKNTAKVNQVIEYARKLLQQG